MCAVKAWRLVRKEHLLWVAAACEDQARVAAEDAAADAKVALGQILWMEDFESVDHMKLNIPHFTPEQLGDAFEYGPLSLDTIVAFCRELGRIVEKVSSTDVLCLCCSGKESAIGNSVLLLGAFLILERRFSAIDVLQIFFSLDSGGGFLSETRFPRPWKSSAANTSFTTADSLTVQDCFFALETAVKQRWLEYDSFNVEAWRAAARAFDAVPVFSISLPDPKSSEGESFPINVTFWIAADPVTTVVDPLERPELQVPQHELGLNCESPKSSMGKQISLRIVSQKSQASVMHTPTREWWARASGRLSKLQHAAGDELPTKNVEGLSIERPHNLSAFAHWLKHKINCSMIVRANSPDERGLAGGSYLTFFEDRGISQLHVPFPDGLPPPMDIASRVIEEVTDHLHTLTLKVVGSKCRDYSIVLHCKAGLGRSMCLMAAVAVAFNPGLDAGTFFGWARLVRPGSIQTASQERFIRSLDEEDPKCCRCFASQNVETKRIGLQEKGSLFEF